MHAVHCNSLLCIAIHAVMQLCVLLQYEPSSSSSSPSSSEDSEEIEDSEISNGSG